MTPNRHFTPIPMRGMVTKEGPIGSRLSVVFLGAIASSPQRRICPTSPKKTACGPKYKTTYLIELSTILALLVGAPVQMSYTQYQFHTSDKGRRIELSHHDGVQNHRSPNRNESPVSGCVQFPLCTPVCSLTDGGF